MDDPHNIKETVLKIIASNKERIESELISPRQVDNAKKMSDTGWVVKFYSINKFALSPADDDTTIVYEIVEGAMIPSIGENIVEWDEVLYAGLLFLEYSLEKVKLDTAGKRYTREGMISRVIEERQAKAKNANYTIKWANNIYGEHILINEYGKKYRITIHDFEKQTGYIDNIDWQTNKLGTTKHIIYLCNQLEDNPARKRRLKKTFPFVDIYLDPFNDYAFSWFYPHELTGEKKRIVDTYFGESSTLADEDIYKMQELLLEIESDDQFKIRKEVYDKITRIADYQMLEIISATETPDYSVVKADLFSYQKEGVAFALFKKAAIIADEMGLGKTLQAITIAILKKQIFGFQKCLVICPASLKHQWKNEIEKFSDEQALVIQGPPKDREIQYTSKEHYFFIMNYETVLRDHVVMNKAGFDLIILDEAQRIKNYETKTASAIQKLHKQHGLVLTGTPIENKIIDLYSIMLFLDMYFLTPLWEFSYQHCLFDHSFKNKITGYYNLNNLNQRLQEVLIRREKREVLTELPNLIQQDIPVRMSQEQSEYHASFGKGVAAILAKKYKTTFDWQRLMLLLNSMRMAADSTYLIDKQTNISPKLEELKHILSEKINIKASNRKIIIFSEWITMLGLIEELMLEMGIGYAVLTGKIPVKKRQALIKEFETNVNCQVFLSTEAGGTGLNLQMADTVINFELPWNPAKKNQRIGRIDRIGQKHSKLSVFNLISVDSIEMKIASGLELKQNLFEGVLNKGNTVDSIDFTDKGRAQFIKELEDYFASLSEEVYDEALEEAEVPTGNLHIVEEEELIKDDERLSAGGDALIPSDIEQAEKGDDSGASAPVVAEPSIQEVEEVFTKGLEFLSGIYKMSTGKDLMPGEGARVKMNEETGEVTFTFKFK